MCCLHQFTHPYKHFQEESLYLYFYILRYSAFRLLMRNFHRWEQLSLLLILISVVRYPNFWKPGSSAAHIARTEGSPALPVVALWAAWQPCPALAVLSSWSTSSPSAAAAQLQSVPCSVVSSGTSTCRQSYLPPTAPPTGFLYARFMQTCNFQQFP